MTFFSPIFFLDESKLTIPLQRRCQRQPGREEVTASRVLRQSPRKQQEHARISHFGAVSSVLPAHRKSPGVFHHPQHLQGTAAPSCSHHPALQPVSCPHPAPCEARDSHCQRCACPGDRDAFRAVPQVTAWAQPRYSFLELFVLSGRISKLSLEQAPVWQCRKEEEHVLFLQLKMNCFSSGPSGRAAEGKQESR